MSLNDETGWRNFYRCPQCKNEWDDEWSSIVNDDCPICGCRHVEPHMSEETIS